MNTVYIASSWRNARHDDVVAALTAAVLPIYDYRTAGPDGAGFAWSLIDPACENWTADQYRAALQHPLARAAFQRDADALRDAIALVAVTPLGVSSALETGIAIQRHIPVFVVLTEGVRADLMM